MLGIDKEVAALAVQPTDERLRALKRIIPLRVITSTLKQTGQTWCCSRLPKWFVVWFVIGLGLFHPDSYQHVCRWLQRRRLLPGRSTLCEARRRLGVAPLRHLFLRVVRLLAVPTTLKVPATPDAFYADWRLMALDGFVLDLPDTLANERVFGRPNGGRTAGAFPQARVLALCEIGTHVLWRCLIKPLRRAEITMAGTLLRHLTPDMLLLWDRGLLSYRNVRDVRQRDAHLLARLKKNLRFTKLKAFRDGSYLAKLYPATWYRTHDRQGIEVRIIAYTIQDPGRPGSGQPHRLLTTLLDADAHPARRLIELYHQRWETELAIDELKTHQRDGLVLRSQTPAGVVQEIYGLLLAHFVVRSLLAEAAATKQLPPRRLSFTGALKILRCRLPQCPRSEPARHRWYTDLITEIAEELLPPRRNRTNPRVIKRKMSKWEKKKPKHRRSPQPTKEFHKSIKVER